MNSTRSFSGAPPTTTFGKQSVKVAAASLAIGALMAFGATPARADLTNLSVTINSGVVGNAVSYSQPASGKQAALSVWAAFGVDVSNPSPNNVSNAWITFTNSSGTALKVPTDITSVGGATATCAPGAVGPTPAVICQVSLAGGSVGSLHFTLRALSPQQDAQPLPTTLNILWSVQTGQGSAAGNPSQVTNTGAQAVGLVPGTPTNLRGYIDAATPLAVQDGGSVQAGGAAGSSTTVAPQALSFTVQDLAQAVVDSSCSSQYKICLQSSLSIPGATFSPPLFVDLLRTKSTLRGGAKIDNVVLSYTPDGISVALPIIQCDGPSGLPGDMTSWSIPDPMPLSNALGRCFIPASPTNPFTYVDKATGDWHIRLLENTNGIINW